MELKTKVKQAGQVAKAELMGLKTPAVEQKTHHSTAEGTEHLHSGADGTEDPQGRAEDHHRRAEGTEDLQGGAENNQGR